MKGHKDQVSRTCAAAMKEIRAVIQEREVFNLALDLMGITLEHI